MTKEDIIQHLDLEKHPMEGGYFRRTYESKDQTGDGDNRRRCLSSIYYLLTSDSPIGFLHKNRSDIIHYYHLGSALRYFIVSPDGHLEEKVLGPNMSAGETPQLLVKGGYWKASILDKESNPNQQDYGLISEAVCPGFEYQDNEIATLEWVQLNYPELLPTLEKLVRV